MISDALVARILKGEFLHLSTFDVDGDKLSTLQRSLSTLGRECGVRCNTIPHPTKRGDTGDISIEHLPIQCYSQVISILQQTPLTISEYSDDDVGSPRNTHS